MANKIKFYKVASLPANLTAANDGFYFVKATADTNFKMYIVSSGVAVEIDAVTLAALNSGLYGKFDKPTGTTAQYIRGDGSLATLNKAAVGLSNVDNTSDINKPISTATQTALNLKANDTEVVHKTGNETIAGTKTFSSAIVSSPAPTSGTHLTNKTYVDGKDSALQTQIDDLSTAIQQGLRTPTDIDCSTNPNYPISAKGATYVVTKAGKIGGAAGPDVEIGDMIICKTATTTAGTHAAVGVNFFIVQTNLSQATETIAGFAKIATQSLTDSGTDDATFVTPKKLATKLAEFITSDLDARFVRYDASQTLTSAQQTQVQTNLNVPSKAQAVLITGTQTVTGVKTFSAVPKSSVDASAQEDLVRLSQVQTMVGDAEMTWSAEDWV